MWKNRDISIQEYLSLGYIFLLILGILGDTIYYHLLGINIISYSSVLDVLLSPIYLLTENLAVPIVTVFAIALMYYTRVKFSPKFHEKNKLKKWYKKIYNVEQLDKRYSTEISHNHILQLSAFAILALFVGLRTGAGLTVKKKMEGGSLKLNHNIIFRDAEQLNAAIVGQNSLYIFYVAEEDNKLTISPIEGNIKKILKIKSD